MSNPTASQRSSTRPGSPTRAALRIARPSAIRTVGLHKSYRRKGIEVPVLKGVDLEIPEGCFTAIVGKSGSGKSTLLHLLGTLDTPDAGEIWYENERIDHLPARRKDHLRNQKFGMIFQFYHLLPELTTLENVLVPQMVGFRFWTYLRRRKEFIERAKQLLDRVGLSHRLTHRPSQLSGGEMQRTAIARSLMARPSLLLADEPTGNLDEENGAIVMETMLGLCRDEGITLAMVTHDDRIATLADHQIRLVNGRVE